MEEVGEGALMEGTRRETEREGDKTERVSKHSQVSNRHSEPNGENQQQLQTRAHKTNQ